MGHNHIYVVISLWLLHKQSWDWIWVVYWCEDSFVNQIKNISGLDKKYDNWDEKKTKFPANTVNRDLKGPINF